MPKSVPLIISLALGALADILLAIAIGTKYWITSTTSTRFDSGLWATCMDFLGRHFCFHIGYIKDLPGLFATARVCAVLGNFVVTISVLFTIIYLFSKDAKLILKSIVAAAFFACVMVLVSFATFVAYYAPLLKDGGYSLSWSFALCVVAFVLILAHACLALFVLVKTKAGNSAAVLPGAT